MDTKTMKSLLGEYGKTFEDYFNLFSIKTGGFALTEEQFREAANAAGWKKRGVEE